jgi:hypothetical protein
VHGTPALLHTACPAARIAVQLAHPFDTSRRTMQAPTLPDDDDLPLASDPPSEIEWADFKALIGPDTPIPAAYEDFLHTYDIRRLKDCVFFDSPEGQLSASVVFPVTRADRAALQRHLGLLREAVGRSYFPIADDAGGNFFLLGCGETNAGEIAFWNHETGALLEVAPTFEDFIEALYPDRRPAKKKKAGTAGTT